MFPDSDVPRVFGLAPGVDFPMQLARGILARLGGASPDKRARVQIIVNSARMRRQVTAALRNAAPGLQPKVGIVTDLGDPRDFDGLEIDTSYLRRRFELVALVSAALDQDPNLAPRSSLFDLADTLVSLVDEMRGEGVPLDAIEGLDVSDLSGHWQRSLDLLAILKPFFAAGDAGNDSAGGLRAVVERRIARWADTPPDTPVILAGSTGSRGTTRLLMEAIARLPQGAVVLPGFDFDMPDHVWSMLGSGSALAGEDHPQFRYATLCRSLDLKPKDIAPWTKDAAPRPAMNCLLSLALRPAPVTNQWRTDGPKLPDLDSTCAHVSLIEANAPRDEALAIALRLREAAEHGQKAALITPDRMLTRQVTAALHRWGILPDDSAGTPLQQTAPGRFLRHIGTVFHETLTAERLITILKHPLCHQGAERGPHLLKTRALELFIRRTGVPYPNTQAVLTWAEAEGHMGWATWVADTLLQPQPTGPRPMTDWLEDHVTLAQRLCAGSDSDDSARLWDKQEGRAVRDRVAEMQAHAEVTGPLSARDYTSVFNAVLSAAEVREVDTVHPDILIWGTLEARVMGADVLILGGLNEGSWPEMPGADPWLNRRMRHDIGLLVPERRIGLSAHDFQQAAGAREVWLSRSLRSADAETVPSRWINRLTNLLVGLPGNKGDVALREMRARGALWLARANALETPRAVPPASRPAPCPPVAARPTRLSVTQIETLVRDPFAIYAREVLRLHPLMPLQRAPDAMTRGTLLHEILEQFVRATVQDPALLTAEHLIEVARYQIASDVPWPAMQPVWLATVMRNAEGFVAQEAQRQQIARPSLFEEKSAVEVEGTSVTLVGKGDRIDLTPDGGAIVYDYKTGTLPSPKQMETFSKQLYLLTIMTERGAFGPPPPKGVLEAAYLGFGSELKAVTAPFEDLPPAQAWEEFRALLVAYQQPDQGYVSRNANFSEKRQGDYDHLARFGEWDGAALPQREDLA